MQKLVFLILAAILSEVIALSWPSVGTVITSAPAGSTVFISSGTYTNCMTNSGDGLAISNSVTVVAAPGGVVIDCGLRGRSVNLQPGANVTFVGFTFANGNPATAPTGPKTGGTIFVAPGATLNVTQCSFVNSTADAGPAIAAVGAQVIVSGSTFAGLNASFWGAVSVSQSILRVQDSSFLFNAVRPGSGSGITCRQSSTCYVQRTSFSSNSAEYAGGGMFISASTAYIDQSDFTKNDAANGTGFGAAMWMEMRSTVSVVASRFSGNFGRDGTFALYSASTLTVNNSDFWGNVGAVASVTVITENSTATYDGVRVSYNRAGTKTVGCLTGPGVINTVTAINSTFCLNYENSTLVDTGTFGTTCALTTVNTRVCLQTPITNATAYCPPPPNATATCNNYGLGGSCTVQCAPGFDNGDTAAHLCTLAGFAAGAWAPPVPPCADIDECAQYPKPCGKHTICTNTIGSFNCSCKPGFTLAPGGKCTPIPAPGGNPYITALSPAISDPLGSNITVTGANFPPDATVMMTFPFGIGNVSCVTSTLVSDKVIVCLTPAWNVTAYVSVWVTSEIYDSTNTLRMLYSVSCPVLGNYGCAGVVCGVCPPNGICPGGCRMWPMPGFWMANENEPTVRRCVDDRCVGCPTDASGVNMCQYDGVTDRCAPGYSGTVCASCAEGFYEDSGRCLSCASGARATFQVLDTIFLTLFVFVCYFCTNRVISRFMFFVILFQTIRSVGSRASSRLPEYILVVYRVLAATSMETSSMVNPQCGLSRRSRAQEYLSSFFGTVAIWAAVVIALCVGVPLVSYLRGRFCSANKYLSLRVGTSKNGEDPVVTTWRQYARLRVARSLIVFFYAFYSAVTTLAFDTVNCVLDPVLGGFVLVRNPDVSCFVDVHVGAAVASVLLLFLVTLSFPLLSGWLVRRERSLPQRGGMGLASYYYDQVKARSRYYVICYMIFVFVQVCVNVFLSIQEVAQLIVGLLNCAAVMTYLLALRPYAVGWRNVMAPLSLSVTMLGFILNFVARRESAEVVGSIAAGFVAGWLAIFAIILAVVFWRRWKKRKDAKAQHNGPMLASDNSWFSVNTINPIFRATDDGDMSPDGDRSPHWEENDADGDDMDVPIDHIEMETEYAAECSTNMLQLPPARLTQSFDDGSGLSGHSPPDFRALAMNPMLLSNTPLKKASSAGSDVNRSPRLSAIVGAKIMGKRRAKAARASIAKRPRKKKEFVLSAEEYAALQAAGGRGVLVEHVRERTPEDVDHLYNSKYATMIGSGATGAILTVPPEARSNSTSSSFGPMAALTLDPDFL